MEIHDSVEAHTLGEQPNEQIVYQNDYIEVKHVVQDVDTVLVRGFSHISGDTVTYLIDPFAVVDLWAV